MNAPVEQGVGETLRARRRQKNLSVELVAQETRIQQRFVKAMEDENWTEFPARVYLEGFLRKYAALLGLDGDAFVKRIREQTGQAEQPDFVHKPEEARSTHAGAETTTQGPGVLIIAGVIVVLGLLYFVKSRFVQPMQDTAHVETAQVAETPAAPAVPAGGHSFQVRAVRKVWLRVWIDGRMRFEGIVPDAVLKTWTGERDFRVLAGDLSALDLTIDGAKQAVPSAPGTGEINWPSPEAASPAAPPPSPSAPPAAPAH